MLSIRKPNKPFQNISVNLSKSLTPEEVKKLLIKTITAYKEDKISLESLVKFARVLKTNKDTLLINDIKNILEEIGSLSVINTVLDDILYELRGIEKNL